MEHYDQEALASLAKVFDAPLKAHDEAGMWRLGSLGIPMSPRNSPRSRPTYLRGSLTFDLRDDMSFITIPFERIDGAASIAIVLRSNNEDLFGTCYPANDAQEAERVAAFLNGKLDEQRAHFEGRDR
jgi:hypothetical protein